MCCGWRARLLGSGGETRSTGEDEAIALAGLVVEGVSIEQGALNLVDESQGLDVSVSEFNLDTGVIEPGSPVAFGLSGYRVDERKVTGYPPGQPLDSEAVASLVNDILVEQARRHGVDLS